MHTYELVCVWLSDVNSRLDWQVVHDNMTTVGEYLDDQRLSEETSKLEVVLQDKFNNKPFFDATAPVRAKYGANFAALMQRIADVK